MVLELVLMSLSDLQSFYSVSFSAAGRQLRAKSPHGCLYTLLQPVYSLRLYMLGCLVFTPGSQTYGLSQLRLMLRWSHFLHWQLVAALTQDDPNGWRLPNLILITQTPYSTWALRPIIHEELVRREQQSPLAMSSAPLAILKQAGSFSVTLTTTNPGLRL